MSDAKYYEYMQVLYGSELDILTYNPSPAGVLARQRIAKNSRRKNRQKTVRHTLYCINAHLEKKHKRKKSKK